MRLVSRFLVPLMVMFATCCCLVLVSGCATSVNPVATPAPSWRPCLLPIPDELMSVRQAEDRLLQAERALVVCDVQGKAIIRAWPK